MGNFSDIPTDILLDILTRLPTESVLVCKLVCRPWRNLVSHHPCFAQLHFTRLNQLADSGKLSFIAKSESRIQQQLQYFEYIENHDGTPPTHRNRKINLTLPFGYYFYEVTGSFNGLVCIYVWGFSYFICNPVTREYVMLPKIKRHCDDDRHIRSSRGFGYLPSTNEYKVVELLHNHNIKGEYVSIEVAVYTLGSGNGWRNLGRFDTKFGEICKAYGAFVNGVMYWVDKSGKRVYVFDLTEEKFGEPVSLPLLPPNSIGCDAHLGVLGGVLYYPIMYYCETTACTITDIWLLKEKNDDPDMNEQVKHKPFDWNKEFSLPGTSEPLAFTKTGGVLCFNGSSLGIYDPTASTMKNLMDLSPLYKMTSYKKTLVSLKELGEEDVKVMEPTEIEETPRK